MQIAANEQAVTVGLGDICVSQDPSTSLACFGLGSCISLCAYDPVAKVAGMAHIVLPESNHSGLGKPSAKFADIAIPRLIEEMCQQGAIKSRLVVKLAGGAQMIESAGFDAVLEMGTRNLEMTKKILASEGIRLSATDTGGNQGRSVWMMVRSGKVVVRTAGAKFRELG